MFDPMTVKSASDLPSELPVVVETQGNLCLKAQRPFSYKFHWLREMAVGAIEGDLGLNVDAGGDVSAQLVVNSSYRQRISLDERGWLRLEILKNSAQSFDFAAQLSVSAQARTPLPDKPDALVAAILGVHEDQWLKDLSKLKESASGVFKDLLSAIDPGSLGQLMDLWNGLEYSLARKVWNAAGDNAALQNLTGGVLTQGGLAETLRLLKAYAVERVAPTQVASGLASLAGFQGLDSWVRTQVEALFGPVRTESERQEPGGRLGHAARLEGLGVRKSGSRFGEQVQRRTQLRLQVRDPGDSPRGLFLRLYGPRACGLSPGIARGLLVVPHRGPRPRPDAPGSIDLRAPEGEHSGAAPAFSRPEGVYDAPGSAGKDGGHKRR